MRLWSASAPRVRRRRRAKRERSYVVSLRPNLVESETRQHSRATCMVCPRRHGLPSPAWSVFADVVCFCRPGLPLSMWSAFGNKPAFADVVCLRRCGLPSPTWPASLFRWSGERGALSRKGLAWAFYDSPSAALRAPLLRITCRSARHACFLADDLIATRRQPQLHVSLT